MATHVNLKAGVLESQVAVYVDTYLQAPTPSLSNYPIFESNEAELIPYCKTGSVYT
ncbi:hypothetical protein BH09PAT1_BH09PAT1_8730 [soil metagenome]